MSRIRQDRYVKGIGAKPHSHRLAGQATFQRLKSGACYAGRYYFHAERSFQALRSTILALPPLE